MGQSRREFRAPVRLGQTRPPPSIGWPARASFVLMLYAGLACSSGSSGPSGQGGSVAGQGGVGGGNQGNGSSGGSPTSGTGGGGQAAGGPGSAGGSKGGSTGSSGVSGRSGLDAGAADTRVSDASTGGGAAMDAAVPAFHPCPTSGDCKILPLGDSITYGAGADPGDGGGYRDELFTRAVNGGKHITFVGSLQSGPTMLDGRTFPQGNEGHIGWTISQINSIATTTQTVSVSGTSYAGALRDIPQIVLLFAGTNDEGYATSEAGASDRLGALIDKIVAAVPDALLVVSSIYPFPGCKATNYTPTQCAANVAVYDAAIPSVIQQRVAKGAHVLFVDMSTMPSDGLSSDGVHPNITVGYPWMGDNWYAVIEPYLR